MRRTTMNPQLSAPPGPPPRLHLDLLVMSFCGQYIVSYLWVPLTLYARDLQLGHDFLGKAFALGVGVRFVPTMLMTRIGASAEFAMMAGVVLGYATSCFWPREEWALYVLAAGAGMGFAKPCIILHAKQITRGDIDELSLASKRCGAARSFATFSNYIVTPLIYMWTGWLGVCLQAIAVAAAYTAVALSLRLWPRGPPEGAGEDELVEKCGEDGRSYSSWVDWAISACYVCTELMGNVKASSVPSLLSDHFRLPGLVVGLCISSSFASAFLYLAVLPSLPAAFNQRRPANLVISYFGLFAAWMLMAVGLVVPGPGLCVYLAGVIAYTCLNQAAQVITLECLTGVCDLQTATRVMGISEALGCIVGVAGSYLGQMLLSVAPWAPCAAMGGVALATWAGLTLTIGYRRWQRSAVCYTQSSLGELLSAGVGRYRGESYIGAEINFRQKNAARTSSQQPSRRSRSSIPENEELEDDDEVDLRNEAEMWHVSTARARRAKRLHSNFDLAGYELDRSDHDVAPESAAEVSEAVFRRTSVGSLTASAQPLRVRAATDSASMSRESRHVTSLGSIDRPRCLSASASPQPAEGSLGPLLEAEAGYTTSPL